MDFLDFMYDKADLEHRYLTQGFESVEGELRDIVYSRHLERTGYDDARAQDLTQMTLIKIHKKGHTFNKKRGELLTWVYAVAQNTFLDDVRKISRLSNLKKKYGEEVNGNAGQELSQRYTHQGREDYGALHEILSTLSPEQREAIELTYFHGNTQKQTSKLIDAPLGTVKARIRRGLRQMHGELRSRGLELSDFV